MPAPRYSPSPVNRAVLLLSLAAVSVVWFATGGARDCFSATVTSDARQPVLVELFTSEGCSSCPPADALLARLDATQFIPGAEAIVLSEHVTYWNDGGWRDPFSQEAFTERQHEYVVRLGLQSAYTPQIVVDGVADVLGSDAATLTRRVTRAAAKPKPQLNIEAATWQGDMLHFAVRTTDQDHSPLVVVLAEDQTQSSVSRGENAGRMLRHVAVARVLKDMGPNAADGRPLTLKLVADKGAAAQGKSLRLVVFLVDRHSGRVQAIAEEPVRR